MGTQDQRAQLSCKDEPTSWVNDRFQLELVLPPSVPGLPLTSLSKGDKINQWVYSFIPSLGMQQLLCFRSHGGTPSQQHSEVPAPADLPAASRERLGWEEAWSRGQREAWGLDGADHSSFFFLSRSVFLSLVVRSQSCRAAVLHLRTSTTRKGPMELPFPMGGTFFYD